MAAAEEAGGARLVEDTEREVANAAAIKQKRVKDEWCMVSTVSVTVASAV